MSNIDDEIDKICQTLAWAGSYIDSGQQVVDEISIEKATQAISQLITDAIITELETLKHYSDPVQTRNLLDNRIKELKENK